MKRMTTLLLAVATLLPGAFFPAQPLMAQDGVFAVYPARPDGKALTMEDVILGGTSPRRGYGSWDGDVLVTEAPRTPWRHDQSTFYTEGRHIWWHSPDGVRSVAMSDRADLSYGGSVSRSEFGIEGGLFPSPDETKLAFFRKDESRVSDFPLLDITTRTGSNAPIKYPMNGMASEHISLGIFDTATGETVYADVTDFDDERYLTNISWSHDGSAVFIQVLDRSQHEMHLNRYDATTGAFLGTVLTETNEAWIEPLDPLYPLDGHDGWYIYRTDNRDGYRSLYLLSPQGTLQRLTTVDADVAYVASKGGRVFYTSAEVSPVENHLFRIDLSIDRKGRVKMGKPVRLTTEAGWHNVVLNESRSAFIDSWSALNVPRCINVRSTKDGKLVQEVFTAPDPLEEFAACEVDLGTVRSADGLYDNYFRLIKPKDFDPTKKYPVIVYVYGGPHSQLVRNSWLGSIRMWEMLMAQKGYVVYVQDNRGTSNRGAAFEKAINRQCGQAEMADQMEGVKMLCSLPWVDAGRIGVHGWSYGGFMTISLMTHYPEVFKVGVAGGPVIDWKWYEIMYGERYMDTPDTNPEGFEKTSLLNKAADLKGKLLICQGVIDNTVVWEHCLSFVEACIKENVQLDFFPYPTHEHNVYGRDRVHLMDKVTLYFDDYL